MKSHLSNQTRGYETHGCIMRLISHLESRLSKGDVLGFPYIIRADISDSQAFGQKPITFARQLLSFCSFPKNSKDIPRDVVDRATEILVNCPGRTLGSLIFCGHPTVRRDIAQYISQRDNVEAIPEDVWITSGVMDGLSIVLEALKLQNNGKPPGAITCIPQYMGYTCLLKEHGYYEACYFLDEDNNWAHNTDRMEEALNECRKYSDPRCLILVNPANPTSTVLSAQQMRNIIHWAYGHKLIILADEVFEHNVHSTKHCFHSVRKVINAMGPPYTQMPLVSFNSTSKGFLAEPGFRAGYFEAINLDYVVKTHMMDDTADPHCSTASQVILDCLVRPPCPSDPSYELYLKEKTSCIDSLAERAALTEEKLNSIKGITCGPVMATMSAYARVQIPKRAILEAEEQGYLPDMFYAEQLLKSKGVSVAPGSAFGQLPGRFYFRLGFNVEKDKLVELFERLESFQEEFMKTFA
ncbi:alanine aminotransferase 1-like [Haemaphysalis longicornis]